MASGNCTDSARSGMLLHFLHLVQYYIITISVAGLLPVCFKILWPIKWHSVHTILLIVAVLLHSQITSMDRTANVVLDIEGLPQQPDKCCTGSPRMSVCPQIYIIDMSIQ
jgi:hypothetical protein